MSEEHRVEGAHMAGAQFRDVQMPEATFRLVDMSRARLAESTGWTADLEFTGEVVEWRGPAPFHFLVTPPEESEWLQEVMRDVTYGWGMIPVAGRIGQTDFTTSLWPRKGAFWVPLKDAVRAAEGIELGDVVTVGLDIRG